MKLIIVDDDERLQEELHRDLSALLEGDNRFEFSELKKERFNESVTELEKRREELLHNGTFTISAECEFDKADVLIVENDLMQFHFGYTAEFVAYHARCFSRCGFIIGVDQYGKNSFDLTLHDHPKSFADVNLGSKQLLNLGLWRIEEWPRFRPWAWPLIPDAVQRFSRRCDFLQGKMDQPLFPTLGFEKTVSELLPREIIEFVSRKKELEKFFSTTLREFLFDSGNGLERKDAKDKRTDDRRSNFPEELQCRIAAARLAKWLECLVLPCQDILIDAPHLVKRFPSLLTTDQRTEADANKAAQLRPPTELGVNTDTIKQWEFAHSEWLSRPTWFFEELRRSDSIAEVKDPWNASPLELVFCEDTSRFAPEANSRPFEAELPTPDARRWVADLSSEGISYEPEVRFAL